MFRYYKLYKRKKRVFFYGGISPLACYYTYTQRHQQPMVLETFFKVMGQINFRKLPINHYLKNDHNIKKYGGFSVPPNHYFSPICLKKTFKNLNPNSILF